MASSIAYFVCGALAGAGAVYLYLKPAGKINANALHSSATSAPAHGGAPQMWSDEELEKLEQFEGNYKMVLVINTSLKMTHGKIAAQCGHATLGAFQMGLRRSPLILKRWEYLGQAKIALKGNSTPELDELEKKAKAAGLLHCLIMDQGRTQIPAGSKTVLAIGPALAEDIDKITGHLKLY